MFKTIIWATDGSETADGALSFAKALAACDGGKLVVVHNNELLVGKAGGYPLLADEDELEGKIHDQVDELKAEGFDVSLKLVTGVETDAAHLIADAAREAVADVIVVGTRGHAPVAGILVGSLAQRLVTQRLLHIAPCPVMAVPAAKQREQRDRNREHAATSR
ncbi:MAG: universal stress protein [Actinomycetota bacterium]